MTFNWNGKRRWLALILLIVNVILVIRWPPVIPVIQLPGEVYPGIVLFGLPMTNTLAASVVVWILIGLLIFFVGRARPRSGGEVPAGGFYGFFELLFEGLYNFVEGIAGERYMRYIFSFFMTIFIVVLLSNWIELVPGSDSIGFLEPHIEIAENGDIVPEDGGYDVATIAGINYLNAKCPWVSPEAAAAFTPEELQARADAGCMSGTAAALETEHAEETAALDAGANEGEVESEAVSVADAESETLSEGESVSELAEEAEHHFEPGDPSVPWAVLPFLRPPSTDLNLTIALALISVVMTQVIGVRVLGLDYFSKFLNFKTLLTSPAGGMDLAIGLLELIGEIAKILSFSFRLLGNIFAGSILLFVVSSLIPVLIPWPVFLFEFFVGIIQALIFGLLTVIFMSSATIGHHAEEEH